MVDIQLHCRRCSLWKAARAFDRDSTRESGRYPWCKLCRKKYMSRPARSYISDDISKLCLWCGVGIGGSHANVKYCGDYCKGRKALASMYGLSLDEYKALIDSMDGKCPICWNKPRRWCMDHKHDTGETFGPVCNSCNTKLIAWTFHDPEIAQRLKEFLENPPVRRMFGPRYVSAKTQTRTVKGVDYSDPTAYPHGLKRGGKTIRRSRKGKVSEDPPPTS